MERFVFSAGTDLQVLTNLYDGLLESDEYGKLVPAVAESWETEDNGITWTFHLRQGVKWVDQNGNEKGEVTAQDFLTGLEWVLNFHKNDATNTSYADGDDRWCRGLLQHDKRA